jgi:hypothetical protein
MRIDRNQFLAPRDTAGWQRTALTVGVLGIVGAVIALVIDRDQFFRSWLIGFLWIWGATIGCMAWLLVYHLTGGNWGTVTRRIFEAGTRCLPLAAVAAIPVVIGMHRLFVWSRPEERAKDPYLAHHAWLNTPGFIGRMIGYFVIWFLIAWYMNKISARQDEPDAPGSPEYFGKLRGISGICVIVTVFTLTFGAIDWSMSLDPHWYSSMWGFLFADGQALTALALGIMTLAALKRFSPMAEYAGPNEFHDLGNLQLAMTMVWAYFWFSQYLIIWSGNMPEETIFLIRRTTGGWQFYTVPMFFGTFVIPFCLMLSRALKRDYRRLRWLAAWVFLMRLIDLIWIVEPNFHRTKFYLSVFDFVIPAGLMGLWVAFFLYNLAGRTLMPVNESHVIELVAKAEAGHGH